METTLHVNDPTRFTTELTEAQQQMLLEWLRENLVVLPPDKHMPHQEMWRNNPFTYGLTLIFEDTTGLHITNGAMKGAWLAAGLAPVHLDPRYSYDINWALKGVRYTGPSPYRYGRTEKENTK